MTTTTSPERHDPEKKRKRVVFFGHFGGSNFGNESTLQAILYHLRRFHPNAEVTCICTDPKATAAIHHIEAIPVVDTFFQYRIPQNPLLKIVLRVCIGIPSEAYRWVRGFMKLRGSHMLIIPGTGLLTDADGLLGYGPYSMLKWSLLAKMCRCKLLFVSVGAGPIHTVLGRCFVKWALSLADFRSYRDNSTKQYLQGIGFHADEDPVYPDLVFSLPEAAIPHQGLNKSRRPVAGLGLMVWVGKLRISRPSDETYRAYLENLVGVVSWWLAHEYDIRLLIGDLQDRRATKEFKDLVRERLGVGSERHIIDEPACSVEGLVSQIAAIDIVVATRFHNIILASLCNKPVIALSSHHKYSSLMSAMGLSEYCLEIHDLKAEHVIDRFVDLEINADKLKPLIRERTTAFRKALDEQYRCIFNDMWVV